MTVNDLPALNAVLNTISAALLLSGFIQIKKKRPELHKKLMLSALFCSVLFLVSYLYYHSHAGSVPYPHYDWTRPIYFIVLIPHIILAAIMGPFIVLAVWHAWHENFQKHVRLVRWVFPVWMFVSVSGVIIYLMLYRM